jgi:hypothetical protein
MRLAIDLLKGVLGDRVHINAVWSHANQRFERK